MDTSSAPAAVNGGAAAGSDACRAADQPVEDSSSEGQWEVDTVRRGWAPLAPALQSALDFAMASSAARVEILIDPVERAWLADPSTVDEARRRRCAVYVALPKESRMGKVGGEPPRAVRRQPACASSDGDPAEEASGRPEARSAAAARAACLPPAAAGPPGVPRGGTAVTPSAVGTAVPTTGASPGAACAAVESLATGAGGGVETAEPQEEEDALMFTAKPADGVVLHSSIFERLQRGVSERYAGYRYAAERCQTAELYSEAAEGEVELQGGCLPQW